MNEKVVKAGLVLMGIAWVKAYGKYHYYRGKVDANNANRIIIDVQKMIIDALNDKLDECQKGKAR